MKSKLTRLHRRKDWCNTCELGVEIACIRRIGDLRLERWLDSLVIDVVPIDVSEERLAHDFLCIGRTASKTLIRLPSEKLLQDGDRVARHVNRV